MLATSKVTKQELKALDHILDFMETEYFLDSIKRLRKEYGIPKDGYIITEIELANIRKHRLNYLPTKFSLDGHDNKTIGNRVNKDVGAIHKGKLELTSPNTTGLLKFFLFFNSKDFNALQKSSLAGASLVTIRDLKMEEDEGILEYNQGTFNERPVAITLHPETTKRDLLDFIAAKWVEIEARMTPYKTLESRLKNIKLKSLEARKRDDIIYKNKDKTIKEIRRELGDAKVYLDDGNIANYKKKIVAKRKKV